MDDPLEAAPAPPALDLTSPSGYQLTDLRAGYDKLYGINLHELGHDPMRGDLFLSVNRRRRSAKVFS